LDLQQKLNKYYYVFASASYVQKRNSPKHEFTLFSRAIK
jgi:hypothetical protein